MVKSRDSWRDPSSYILLHGKNNYSSGSILRRKGDKITSSWYNWRPVQVYQMEENGYQEEEKFNGSNLCSWKKWFPTENKIFQLHQKVMLFMHLKIIIFSVRSIFPIFFHSFEDQRKRRFWAVSGNLNWILPAITRDKQLICIYYWVHFLNHNICLKNRKRTS